jgi:hypothetical protein
VGRVVTICDEGSGDAPGEEGGDHGKRAEVADVDEVGDEDLDPCEDEDERDRLAQVPEAAHEDIDQCEEEPGGTRARISGFTTLAATRVRRGPQASIHRQNVSDDCCRDHPRRCVGGHDRGRPLDVLVGRA